MDLDWKAKGTIVGYILATVGTGIGIYVGSVLGPKILVYRRNRKISKSFEKAIDNIYVAQTFPDEPSTKP